MPIDGTWISFIGLLTLTSNGTSLTGTYQPANANPNLPPPTAPLPLVGWTNSTNDPSVGWTALSAAGGNDVTSWAGQYYADGQPETIIAFRIQQTVPASGVPIGSPTTGEEVFVRRL